MQDVSPVNHKLRYLFYSGSSLTLKQREQVKMMASIWHEFMFPCPASFFITTMTVVYVVSLALLGLLEVAGWHLQYSKLQNFNPNQKPLLLKNILSSRAGMVLSYSPSFLLAISSFWIFPDVGLRLHLVRSTITIHFFKRVFESLFIHKYSSNMVLEVVIFVTCAYFTGVVSLIYAQHLTRGLAEPDMDTKHVGMALFLLGISGNLYHHYILSKLRKKDGEKGYKVPKGGLFGLVVCPHYLFEIVEFVGISLICQTLYAWSFTIGSALFLMGRSYSTRKWYLAKFEDFPKHVKALIPFVF